MPIACLAARESPGPCEYCRPASTPAGVENRFQLADRLREPPLWSRGDSKKPLIPSTCIPPSGRKKTSIGKETVDTRARRRVALTQIRYIESHARQIPVEFDRIDPIPTTPPFARGTHPISSVASANA